ncbi:hypothetical protein DV515_00000914, partial [Chloebia gouldiae]
MEITLVKCKRTTKAKRFMPPRAVKGAGQEEDSRTKRVAGGKLSGRTSWKAEFCAILQEGKVWRGSPQEQPSNLHDLRGRQGRLTLQDQTYDGKWMRSDDQTFNGKEIQMLVKETTLESYNSKYLRRMEEGSFIRERSFPTPGGKDKTLFSCFKQLYFQNCSYIER